MLVVQVVFLATKQVVNRNGVKRFGSDKLCPGRFDIFSARADSCFCEQSW